MRHKTPLSTSSGPSPAFGQVFLLRNILLPSRLVRVGSAYRYERNIFRQTELQPVGGQSRALSVLVTIMQVALSVSTQQSSK